MNYKSKALIIMVCAGIYVLLGILNSTLSLRFVSATHKDSEDILILSMSANTISGCSITDDGDETECKSRSGFALRFLVFEILPMFFMIGLFVMALLVFMEPEGSPRQLARLDSFKVAQRVGQIVFAAMFLAALKEVMTIYHVLEATKAEGHGVDALSKEFHWSFGFGFYMPFILSSVGLVVSFLPMSRPGFFGGVAQGAYPPPPPMPMGHPAYPGAAALGSSLPPPPPGGVPAAGLTIPCPKCNTRLDSEARFCNNCGHSLSTQCPSCHAVNDSESRFCKTCGGSLH